MPPDADRPRRVSPDRPAIVALVATIVAFVPLALLAARAHGTLLALDRPVTDAVVAARTGWLTPVIETISVAGSRAVLGGMLLGLVVWGALARRCPRSVLVALLVFGMAMVLETVLKVAVERPRPEPALHLDAVSTRAFPSGHATSAAAVAGFLAVLFGGGLRWLLAGTFVVLVGFARVYLGVHWLTDVAGGALLGAAIAAAGVILLRGHRLDPAHCRVPHPPPGDG